MKLKNNVLKIVICVIAVFCIGLIVRNIIKNKSVETSSKTRNVTVQQVKSTSISTTVDYSGKLKADTEVSISPKSPGKVTSLNVKVGSTVNSGDTLFTLDSSNLEAQLEQQQAGIDSANANLNKAQGADVDQQIVQSQQAVNSSSISYNDALTNYNRTKKLYSAGATTKQDLDSAKTKLDTASSSLSSAKQTLNLIKEKVGPSAVAVAQAQVNQQKSGLKSIQTQIDDNTIKSPISGIVSEVNVHKGEISSSAQTSIKIIDENSIMAETGIPDTMMSKVKQGQSIYVIIPSISSKKLKGSVYNITPDVDSKTQLHTLKVKISNTDKNITSGMFCKILMPDEDKKDVIAIPNQAVKVENGVSYVYTVKNNKVKKISVKTGISNDEITEILSSKIHVGDYIITEGQTFLNENDKVRTIEQF